MFAAVVALVGLLQQPEPWIQYTEPGTGFTVSIPKGMRAKKWYPGNVAGNFDPSFVVGIEFSEKDCSFTVNGYALKTVKEREDWQTKMTSMEPTEKIQLKSGPAWVYAGRPNPNRSEFRRSYHLLRHGWGWSIWGDTTKDQVESYKVFLQRVAESFQWEPKYK